MKNKHFLLGLYLLGLSFIIACGAILFMPDTVPIHYDWQGNPDGYGNKSIYLLFPVLFGLVWLLFHLMGRTAFKEDEANRKNLYRLAAYLNFFFIVLETIFIALVFVNERSIAFDFYKLLGACFGIFFILTGNIIPKATRNGFFGLRTTWSLYNDNTWAKSQRSAGFAFVACGFLVLLSSVFLKDILNLLAVGCGLAAVLAVSLPLSYKAYKEERAKENN